MSRVPTANYGAEATTIFQWATTDQDLFDREYDLYHLSQALEKHDHSAGRGLAVSRLAALSVVAASISPLAVQTAAIDNLAVTNAKLGAQSITRDKILYPLVQATNDMPGGFRQQNVAGNFALGFYMDAAGLAVFGAGTPGAVGANLILGQAGQASVGGLQGGGKFNVFQTLDTAGSGMRLFHPNQIHYIGLRNDVVGRPVIEVNGNPFFFMNPTTGYITVGTAATDLARLHINQTASAEDSGQGLRITNAGGNFYAYVMNNGHATLQSQTTAIQLQHSVNALAPFTNNATALGVGGADANTRRWASVNAVDANFSGNVTVSGTLTAPGGGVPLGGVIWFRTAAELTAAGASWTTETSLAGRIPYGAGTSHGQTFAENTNTSSTNWTPASSLSATSSGITSPSLPYSAVGGGTNSASIDHSHTITVAGTGTVWFPPGRVGVFGRRI